MPVAVAPPLVSAPSASAKGAFSTQPQKKDPYHYQPGFGNVFQSEALPGVLPESQNSPQNNKFGLYAEGVCRIYR